MSNRGWRGADFEDICSALDAGGVEVRATSASDFDCVAIVKAIGVLREQAESSGASAKSAWRRLARVEWLLQCSEADVEKMKLRLAEAKGDA